MSEVLDYSSGWPAPAAIKAGGYVGVVRYIATPGRPKNLTPAEATAFRDRGIPIGLVVEGGAGWMLGGLDAGRAAARAALDDAARCGVGVRAVYFAADFDVTDAGQMAAVIACLDGAAQVLGRGRVGVYGEADVIDTCVPAHAAWGWQTRAWSGGQVSDRAHLLQQIGYVYPGGVQADRSTVLRPDWGQWPAPDGAAGEDITIMDADTKTYLDAKFDELNHGLGIVIWGDAPDSQKNPDGTPKDKGGHPFNLEALRGQAIVQSKRVADLTTQLAAADSTIDRLAGLLATQHQLDVDDVRAAVREGIAEGVVHVQVTVDGQQDTAPAEGGQ